MLKLTLLSVTLFFISFSAKSFTANIIGDTIGCPGDTICHTAIFSGGTAPYSYYWDYNNGNYTNNTAGICTPFRSNALLILTITDANGDIAKDTITTYNKFSCPALTASIYGDTIGCPGDTVCHTANFSGGTAPYSYSWDYNNGNYTNNTATICTPFRSNALLILTITDANGDIASDTITTFNKFSCPALTASIIGDTIGCPEDTICHTAAYSGGTAPYAYSWDYNNGNYTNNTAGICTPFRSNALLILTITDANGDIASDTITTFNKFSCPALTASIYGDTIGCPGDTVCHTANFSGGTAPYSYSWDYNNGNYTNNTATICTPFRSNALLILTITDANGDIASDTITTFNKSICGGNTNIESNSVDDFKIYPNPSSDFINIDHLQNDINSIKIYNVTGELLIMKRTKNSRNQTINISNLNKGSYYIIIETTDALQSSIIIKK